ncbi:MAG: exopolysaccharide biosynthesis polyprenyl glycosylphosphotransferase, partial [Proteobacteria bacterium]|nr:exopolysaccharide biosynthesis polyprenyl glycosylphosphotransferase [Pseudomonadota bacterium]MBU2455343.1 exopolysaccharide biosynthesis polyprenyl glycosylphosphotransferase [Pseudomonadota bacterium]
DTVFNFNIVGFIDDYKEIGEKINSKYENLGKLKDLDSLVKLNNVNELLIAIDGLTYSRLIAVTDQCLKTGIVVRIYSNFLEIITKKINVEYYAGLPVVMLQNQSQNSCLWKIKRIIDAVAASVAVVLLFPFFLFVVICIKLSSKGPVIFKQTRIGKNGKPFDFYKFRSMHLNTSDTNHKEYVQDFIKGNTCSEPDGMKIFKIKDDPRIFPFGHFIRKTSIDEFPQLFNVIKGDMSLIGPRPCLPYEWECYDEWHKNRLNILPGCTGLWQVLGRSSVTFEEMVVLDLYYISNLNLLLWLDLKIVLQTIPVIFFGKGGF